MNEHNPQHVVAALMQMLQEAHNTEAALRIQIIATGEKLDAAEKENAVLKKTKRSA